MTRRKRPNRIGIDLNVLSVEGLKKLYYILDNEAAPDIDAKGKMEMLLHKTSVEIAIKGRE